MAWRRRARRGRPRKPDAFSKRRAKTTAGRRPETDLGTAQLRARKRRVAGGREDLELTAAATLLGHGHLDRQQFDTLGEVTLWLQRLAISWGGTGGCHALWLSIVGALVPSGFTRPADARAAGLADDARRRLKRALRRLDGSRAFVIELAEGRVPPIVVRVIDRTLTAADMVALERLRKGLDAVSDERRWLNTA